ncbi:MAG TPA: DUF11 domain-containing protein [Clostridiaceae bacterium]|nr:DUF11 domain-containing protein [Clostridiaceae bacterium]
MKLQNMTVIFIIIMIPIILVVSYYIGLQINTITMQKNYTVKLQTAAKDSIQALEINTVEWNSVSSNLADSKRRDVLAAINTFTTSLANGMGIGGAGKGRIQTYIPAIVYTMYDGYYIYSASLMKDQDTDKDGLTQFNADGTIKSNEKSYQYILKPYSPYSARYANENVDVTVNYTLDNYIRVYGTVDGEYQTKEGYLVVCDSNSNEGVNNVKNGRISEIKYRGAEIKPETLKENVYIVGEEVKEYPYIYDQYDNKLYWDGSNYFSVDKYNNKVYLQNALPEGDAGFSITNRFRKISIPMYDNREDEWTVQKVFQILNPGGGYKFYYENQSGAFVEFTSVENIDGSDNKKLAGVEVEKDKDFSAINYCVESYVFTKWVTKNLGSITVGDMKSPTVGQYNNVDNAKNKNIFAINPSNNPDPENDVAYATSVLAQHKKDIIINTIEKNLSQATEQAKKMNPNYEYRLPQLSYDEWEQALSNISIIAFMQGMPIGLKYYNNYAIATSTLNKEFVDPDELYFAGKDDQYYHQRQCEQATGSEYVGYRSIDYVAKSYEKSDNGTTSTKYYYPHANSTNSELECYYCLVNRSTYKNNGRWKGNLLYKNWSDSYYNALARERYMQLDEPGTYKPNVTVKKTAKPTSVEYGDEIEYTIEITNNGIVDDTITFLDYWNTDELNREESDIKVSSTKNRGSNKIEIVDWNDNNNNLSGISSKDNVGIYIYAGETITITYKAIPKGTLGKDIKNTAAIYSFTNKDIELDRGTATTTVKKTIKVAKTEVKQKNVILVVDTSSSMKTYLRGETGKAFKEKVKKFVKDLQDEGIPVNQIKFNGIAYDNWTVNDDAFWTIWAGTNYKSALEKTNDKIVDGKNNILVFFSDGDPTYPLGPGFPGYTYNERGTTIFGTDNIAKITWNGVESEISTIKGKGVTIYAIGFTNAQADADEDGKDEKNANFEGLQKVFVTEPTDKFINAKNQTDLLNAFDDIAKIITKELEIPDKYTAYNNKVEIQYVNEITSITIGDSTYTVEQAKNRGILVIEGEKGYLDLSKLNDENQLGLNIQINY